MEFKSFNYLPEKFVNLIQILKQGNESFIIGDLYYNDIQNLRKKLLTGQSPKIIVLTCSDSRVVPKLIFKATIGELFVVQNAGNIAGASALGSIEYASSILKSQLLVILGHYSCGAINTAFEGVSESQNLMWIIKQLEPAVKKAKELENIDDRKDFAVRENVLNQLRSTYENSKIIKDCIENGCLAVVGAIYDLNSGAVNFMDECLFSEK